jgi:hypothetical protein
MRKSLSMVVLAVLCWSLSVTLSNLHAQEQIVSPPVLLQNGSFEDPETTTDNPFGDLAAKWGRWGNWMNRETIWEPTHSGKSMIGYHHWEIKEITTSGLFQDVPGVPPGKMCTFSIHAFKDDKTNAESVELRLEKLNGGEAIASKIFAMADIATGGWGTISVSGRNPGEGLRVLIVVTPAQSGTREGCVKFDDATLACE